MTRTKKEERAERARNFKMELAARPPKSRSKKNAQLGKLCSRRLDTDIVLDEDFIEFDPERNYFAREDVPDEGAEQRLEDYVDRCLCGAGAEEESCCVAVKQSIVVSRERLSQGVRVEADYFIGAASVTADEIIVTGIGSNFNQTFRCCIEAAENFIDSIIPLTSAEKIGLKRAHALAH